MLKNACTQAAIRFFTPKNQILQLYPNDHSFFYSKIQNFTVVPKRPFVFLQRSTKFYSCTQTVIRFLQRSTKFYSCTQTSIRFLQRNTKFRIVPKWPLFFFITKQKILKCVPKRPFVFQNEIENFESCTQTANSYFPQVNTKSTYL